MSFAKVGAGNASQAKQNLTEREGITQELGQLHKSLSELEATIMELEGDLTFVLQPVMETAIANPHTPSPKVGSPLRLTLLELAYQVERADRTLRQIARRLDLRPQP